MGMFADIAVQKEMEDLRDLITNLKNQGKTPAEILERLEKEINNVIASTKSGWR